MKKTLLTIISAVMTSALMAQTQVTEFTPGVVAHGVNYMLPKTQLRIDVTAIKIVYTPGEYAKYAERYLHISNVPAEQSCRWQVTGMRVSQEGVPDTTKAFTVKMKDKTVAPMAQLSESGTLLAVNTSVAAENDKTVLPAATSNRLESRQYLTEDILASTSISKRAELTAQEILDIRESKNAIKRGQVESMPKDGASLKIVLDELDLQEQALTQLFAGYADTVWVSRSYTFVPETDIDRNIFFRFSQKLGFVDADDLAGEPYYLTVKDLHTVSLPTEEAKAKRKITGLVYNMPSMARVKIESLAASIYDKELPFAQMGTVDVLSPTLFNKGADTKLTLYSATGGILYLEQ